MSLDLTGLPGLITPAPPSNTLLITNLTNPALFTSSSLATIHQYLEAASQTELHSFSPLKSLRRIIVSFPTVGPAVAVRLALDRTALLGCTARIYFGAPTPVNPERSLLKAPVADKQFFISPPPSPPHGWTMRDEDPPNRDVHAADLAMALAGLRPSDERQHEGMDVVPREDDADGDTEMVEAVDAEEPDAAPNEHARSPSTTVVYEPAAHGAHQGLPAVTVEDTTNDGLKLENETAIREHTARPPVELMP